WSGGRGGGGFRSAIGTAERVKHQQRIDHGRKDRAEAILSVQTLNHKLDRRVDRASANCLREIRLDDAQDSVDAAENLRPRPGLVCAFWPMPDVIRWCREEFGNLNDTWITRPWLERIEHHQRHKHPPC